MPLESRLRRERRERQWLIYADSCALVSIIKVCENTTHLVCDLPRHIPFRPLQRPEGFTEVELNIVTFALHAHSEQNTTLAVKI